jgi:hypothetical protein
MLCAENMLGLKVYKPWIGLDRVNWENGLKGFLCFAFGFCHSNQYAACGGAGRALKILNVD